MPHKATAEFCSAWRLCRHANVGLQPALFDALRPATGCKVLPMGESVILQEVNNTPFASVREKPWAMILFGPIHIGLTTAFCEHCEADSLTRTYHAGRISLIAEDCPENEASNKAVLTSDPCELALSLLAAPCIVTGGPLLVREIRVHPPEHVKEFLKRASPLLFLPMAPQRLIAKVLRSVCPNCGQPLPIRNVQPRFSTPILDGDGMFDVTPIAVLAQL